MKSNQPVQIEDLSLEVRSDIEKLAMQTPVWAGLSSQVKIKYGENYLRIAYDILKKQQKNNNQSASPRPLAEQPLNTQTDAKHITLTLSQETSEKLFQYLDMQTSKSMFEIQKKTLLTTALFLMLSVLFPPYQITVQGMTVSQGFHWICNKGTYQYTGVVDVPLLLCEILVICIIGAIGYKVLPEIKAD